MPITAAEEDGARWTITPCSVFVVSCETGSFATAARDLDVARSVVTRTIQDLEEWTARRVLERTMHAMQLTEACDRFYTYCRRVLQDTEQTLLAMRRAPAELAGRITISPPRVAAPPP